MMFPVRERVGWWPAGQNCRHNDDQAGAWSYQWGHEAVLLRHGFKLSRS